MALCSCISQACFDYLDDKLTPRGRRREKSINIYGKTQLLFRFTGNIDNKLAHHSSYAIITSINVSDIQDTSIFLTF